MSSDASWWTTAAIYQIYVRSFADGNGDGIGDLTGVRSRLDYLAQLGIDAIWFNPWYRSPMADGGYDVTEYREIDPIFGSLDDADKLIVDAHELGIRIIVDVVPNHCSNENVWFTQALDAAPGSKERSRFHFRPGRGTDGELPPNNWESIFGGPAWTRTRGADGSPGEWYLHLFAPEQPDFNWESEDVHAEFEEVLRFWFDKGVDGIRIDSAALLVKDGHLGDMSEDARTLAPGTHPFIDRDAVHLIYERWREIADSYPDPRLLIGEVWLENVERFTRYLRPRELHSAFNFELLGCAFEADKVRAVVDSTRASHALVGATPSWVLSNHDVVREVTRYGRADTAFAMDDRRIGDPVDLVRGTRRARAAALLVLSLPGSVYIYQGQELGLFEVEDLPDEALQDPIWLRSGRSDRGRDGCRVPMPWSGSAPPFGFTNGEATSWLPQPAAWKDLTAEAETGDPLSMLALYREALRIRRGEAELAREDLDWIDAPVGVIAYRRGPELVVVVNLSDTAIELPKDATVVLSSAPRDELRLAPDTAVWLRAAGVTHIGPAPARPVVGTSA